MEFSFEIMVPVVAGIVEMFKRLGLDSKICPLISLVLGILFNMAFKFVGVEMYELILGGVVVGLTASGLYDNIKAITTK